MSIRRTYSAPLRVPRTFFGWKLPLWLSWIVGFTANYASRISIHRSPSPYESIDPIYYYIYALHSYTFFVKNTRVYSWRFYFANDNWHTINFIQDKKLRNKIDKRIKLAAPYLNDIVKQYNLRTHANNDY